VLPLDDESSDASPESVDESPESVDESSSESEPSSLESGGGGCGVKEDERQG
jgi:hypothetical protein